MNLFEQHEWDEDDGQNLGPVDRWQSTRRNVEFEQQHIRKQQEEEQVEELQTSTKQHFCRLDVFGIDSISSPSGNSISSEENDENWRIDENMCSSMEFWRIVVSRDDTDHNSWYHCFAVYIKLKSKEVIERSRTYSGTNTMPCSTSYERKGSRDTVLISMKKQVMLTFCRLYSTKGGARTPKLTKPAVKARMSRFRVCSGWSLSYQALFIACTQQGCARNCLSSACEAIYRHGRTR